MRETFIVNAQSRRDVGKGASRRLRHENKVPAVLYGAGGDAVSLLLEHNEMVHHLANEAFYSHILTIRVDGKDQRAVLRDLQRHPAKPRIMHADFLRISDTHKLQMSVPLHFMGASASPGVKIGSGMVSHLLNNVVISCLPKDLPEYLEVDMSAMELGDSLHLSDIKLPQGVEIAGLVKGSDRDLPVASIHAPRAVVEETPVAAAAEGAAAEAAPKT